MSRNMLHQADRNRTLKKTAFATAAPTRPFTKKRTYSSDSSGGSTVGPSNFRASHSSARKRLSLQNDSSLTMIKSALRNVSSSSESGSSEDEALAEDDDGGSGDNDDEEDEDDDDDDYSGVNDFPIEDLTGENDTEDTKLDISEMLFGSSQIFGEYQETAWTIYDDMDSPALRANAHARHGSQSSEKRVRFEDVLMSTSCSSISSDDVDITDLFMNPQDLPASIRNIWDRSPTPSVAASEDGSFWDFQGSGTETVGRDVSVISPTTDTMDDFSSEESDDGEDDDDETDVEDIDPVIIRRQRRPRSSPAALPSTPLASRISRQPVKAEMALDDDKDYATTVNGKVVHFKSPKIQNEIKKTLREALEQFKIQTQFPPILYDDTAANFPLNFSDNEIISSSGDLNAMFGAHGGLTNFVDVSSNMIASSLPTEASNSDHSPATSTMSYEATLQSVDSEDENYNMDDFIVHVSEDENQNSDSDYDGEPASPTYSVAPQVDTSTEITISQSRKNSKSGILDHLDKSKVGSFRNHQDNHRRLSSFGPDPAQRVSAITPVRPGKSVDLLTTPMRRRANSNSYKKFGRTVQTGHLRQKRGSGSFA